MMKLKFDTIEEFEKLFSYKNDQIANGVYKAIHEAYSFNKKVAELFYIEFADTDLGYEVNLPRTHWNKALKEILSFYEEAEYTDACIDTWQLIEAVKYFDMKG